MKVFYLLLLFSLAVTAFPTENEHIHGENGWYVPQKNGTWIWMDLNEAVSRLNELKVLEHAGYLILNPVDFYLYTALNPVKGQKIEASLSSITNSNFNSSNPTRIIIHGWNMNHKSDVIIDICKALLTKGNFNVIVVNWPRAISLDYASSVAAVSTVGEKIAGFIDFLVIFFEMPLNNLQIIGHSLGAHVAGYTGKNVASGQVNTIVGLDPALPLFSYDLPTERLAMTDATYVESIQTNGGLLGFLKPIGKVANYPNGGKSQPGCGLDFAGACSHNRAMTYYIEVVLKDNFLTNQCNDYQEAVAKDCDVEYSTFRMGALSNEITAVGVFYVAINEDSPYGMGT